MTTRKKKKPPTPIRRDQTVSKTYFDLFSDVARKILRIAELDPALFDTFTKKHKQDMMIPKAFPPRVSPQKGHNIPPVYIRGLQRGLTRYMKTTWVGNPEIRLNTYDYVTVGQMFLSYLNKLNTNILNINETHTEIARTVLDRVENVEIDGNHLMIPLYQYVRLLLVGLSKMNFRIYYHCYDWSQGANPCCLIPTFYICEKRAEQTKFYFRNTMHTFYKVSMGKIIEGDPIHMQIPGSSVLGESESNKIFNVYVQGHALHRLNERLDTLSPFYRNLVLATSVVFADIHRSPSGHHLLSCVSIAEERIGYFPFELIDNNLLILSFIPLSSPNAPEGKRLYSSLNMCKDDTVFLGMDKLSFYKKTDFDAVPLLRDALQEAGIWHLTEMRSEILNFDTENRRTGIIARFFQQTTEEPNRDEMLEEVAKLC